MIYVTDGSDVYVGFGTVKGCEVTEKRVDILAFVG